MQNPTLGHRGRKPDPLYRARRLLTRADERLDQGGRSRLLGLLDAGDPAGEVRTAWHAKEVVRSLYDPHDPDLAVDFVTRLGHDLQTPRFPRKCSCVWRLTHYSSVSHYGGSMMRLFSYLPALANALAHLGVVPDAAV